MNPKSPDDPAADPGTVTLHAPITAGAGAATAAERSTSLATTRRMIPPRYQRRDDDDGPYLTCSEAPNVAVRIERGFTVSSGVARKYPEYSLFVDGAAQGEPFMDVGKKIYNLDHHEGCVRAFTLATCEQAMVLVLKGLDLDAERWTVYANEPDLDTVVAIWVLLNHRRLDDDDGDLSTRVMPLVRLQGAIDAHGFELAELTGFPPDLQRRTMRQIEELRADEVERKSDGTWSDTDPIDYTAAVLGMLDEMMYRASDFADASDVEELERVPLPGDRFAVVCRSPNGIYEVEQQLREVHGERLGLILLEREPSVWTVRQVDPFLPVGLSALYDRLNLIDPNVAGPDRWGGSDDIGGSPRRSGTGLDLRQITGVCRWVYRPPGLADRVRAILVSSAVGSVAVAAAAGIAVLTTPASRVGSGLVPSLGARGSAAFAVALAFAALILMVGRGRAMPRLVGLRRPQGMAWAWFGAPMAVAAAAGGAWIAAPSMPGLAFGALGTPGWWFAGVVVVAAAAAELVFRGFVHGELARVFRVMTPGGERFVSVPVVVTAALSAVATLVLLTSSPLVRALTPVGATLTWAGGALLAGVVAGAVRERSGSVWAAAVLHAVVAVIAWFAFVSWG